MRRFFNKKQKRGNYMKFIMNNRIYEIKKVSQNELCESVGEKKEKGKKIFDLIKDKIDYIEVEYEKVLKYNPNITWDKKER